MGQRFLVLLALMEWQDLIPGLLDFVAALVGSLAWPVALVILILSLRQEIKALIPGLKSVRFRGFEADFAEQLEEAGERFEDEAVGPEAVSTQIEGEAHLTLPPLKANLEGEVVSPTASAVVRRLVQISPRAAVSEAWLLVEDALRRLAKRHQLRDQAPPLWLIRAFQSNGVITESMSSTLHDLRGLRNEALHRLDFEPSSQSAAEYADLADRVRRELMRLVEEE